MLTVISNAPDKPNDKYRKMVECKCDCGKISVVATGNLKSNHTISCGCMLYKKTNSTHKMSKSKEYKSYRKMLERCYYEKDISYHNYGGRGIKVCDRWLNSFENFIEDIGLKPSLKHSLDRINCNGDYEPSNCRWASLQIQHNNKRNNSPIQYNGIVKNICELARELNIHCGLIRFHQKKGRSLEEIINHFKTKKYARF